jgi:hypothetical protein
MVAVAVVAPSTQPPSPPPQNGTHQHRYDNHMHTD